MADQDDEWIAASETDDDDMSSIADSGYDPSGPPSIASSIFDYQYENGRRYHNYRQGKYALPCDEMEQDRLDMLHHIWRLLFRGEIHRAPVKNPKLIADLGTGTGIWACDAGDMYPDARILGLDLSPIQPAWVPPNVSFEIEDLEDKWSWGTPGTFDYIFIRDLAGSIQDWKELLSQAYDYLTPGGYIEIQEHELECIADDNTHPPGSALDEFTEKLFLAGRQAGRSFEVPPKLAPWLVETGYTEVKQEIYKQPWGTWPSDPRYKEIGRWSLAVADTGTFAYGMALFTRVLNMDREEAEALAEGARTVLFDRARHLITRNFVVYGRKPFG